MNVRKHQIIQLPEISIIRVTYLNDLCLAITTGHCYGYRTLNDSWRKKGARGSLYCDNNKNEMDGTNWFRFLEPAGTKLISNDLGSGGYYCDTHISAWLDGADPTIVGQTVDRRVCFSWNGNSSMYSKNIKVSLCKDNNNGQFLIYQLKKCPAGCSWAYCAESN